MIGINTACTYVSTHSRLKAAGPHRAMASPFLKVSTHSRLKAAGSPPARRPRTVPVSTHSRLKAAGIAPVLCRISKPCFNTQPPEGGWLVAQFLPPSEVVSTHSRLKAAGY